MANEVNNKFLIRLKKKTTIDKIDQLVQETGKSKTEIINMALEEGLPILQKQSTDENTKIYAMIQKAVREEIEPIQESLIQSLAVQFVDEKILSSTYQHLLFLLRELPGVDIPQEYTALFDKTMPQQFDEIKEKFLKDLYENY